MEPIIPLIEVPPEFHIWLNQIGKGQPCKLLIVIGHSLTGKTAYFTNLGLTHQYTERNMRGLGKNVSLQDHSYVVIDNIDKWSKWVKQRTTFQINEFTKLFLGEGPHLGKPCVILAYPSDIQILTKIFSTEQYQDRVLWAILEKGLYD